MIYSIDEKIPFSRRHPNETIRDIIRYDSGYLKDIFMKDDRIIFSSQCLTEIQRLTKGHKDNWEKPTAETSIIFDSFKTYSTPYLYDFNDEQITTLNMLRLKNEYSRKSITLKTDE